MDTEHEKRHEVFSTIAVPSSRASFEVPHCADVAFPAADAYMNRLSAVQMSTLCRMIYLLYWIMDSQPQCRTAEKKGKTLTKTILK